MYDNGYTKGNRNSKNFIEMSDIFKSSEVKSFFFFFFFFFFFLKKKKDYINNKKKEKEIYKIIKNKLK